ncbi:hypothetical protein ACP70R_012244 [Stipagrostis hirtigluma subsp. patula]
MGRGRDGLLVSSGTSVKQSASAASGSLGGGRRSSGSARGGVRSDGSARSGGRSGGSSGAVAAGARRTRRSPAATATASWPMEAATASTRRRNAATAAIRPRKATQRHKAAAETTRCPSTRSDPPGALLYDSDWNGEATGTDLRYDHGYVPQKKVCWTEDGRCGRRFLGCPLEDDEDEQCKFVHCIDDAWAPRVQKTLRQMWVVVRHSTTEARKAENDKKVMAEKLQRTEATMNAMVTVYEWRVQADAEDKRKGWVLAFCLVGVIVAMLYLVLLPKLAK